MMIFRGVNRSKNGGYCVNFRDKYVCTVPTVEEAIAKRRSIEKNYSLCITEGSTKLYVGGVGCPYKVRVTTGPDGQLWFFAGDLCTSIGYNYTTYGKYADKVPDQMQGLVHRNHGKRSYRVYNLEGALTFLAYVTADTSAFKKWILLYVIPATLLTKEDRIIMAHYALRSVAHA